MPCTHSELEPRCWVRQSPGALPPAQATALASAVAGDWATAEEADQAGGHWSQLECGDSVAGPFPRALDEKPVPWVLQQVCQGLLDMQTRPVAESAIADAVAAAAVAAGNAAVAGVAASAGWCHTEYSMASLCNACLIAEQQHMHHMLPASEHYGWMAAATLQHAAAAAAAAAADCGNEMEQALEAQKMHCHCHGAADATRLHGRVARPADAAM